MSTERGQSALSSAPVHTRPSTVHSLSATTFFIRNISRVSAISFSFSIYRDRQQIDCLPTNENVLFLKISTRRVTCITFAVWTNQDDPDVSAKFVGNTKSSKEKKKRGDVRSPITPLDQGKRKYKKKIFVIYFGALSICPTNIDPSPSWRRPPSQSALTTTRSAFKNPKQVASLYDDYTQSQVIIA